MRVYEYASSVSRIIGNMADQFVDQADNIQGELTIEIASHLQCQAFDATLTHYHSLFPNVIFNVNTHPSADIVSHVADGLLRIGLSNKRLPKPGFVVTFSATNKWAFIAAGRTRILDAMT